MKHPLVTLAAAFDEAHYLTHVATEHPEEPPVPVYRDGFDTGLETNRVRFTYTIPTGERAERLHVVRCIQIAAFAAVADQALAGGVRA